MTTHLLNYPDATVQDMKAFYAAAAMYPTSTNGDVALIRSHIAYHCGQVRAERASIKPSRGHSYRVAMYGEHDKHDTIVRISDHYDHRNGVVGII